jgi:hypothetical protein
MRGDFARHHFLFFFFLFQVSAEKMFRAFSTRVQQHKKRSHSREEGLFAEFVSLIGSAVTPHFYYQKLLSIFFCFGSDLVSG